MKKILTSALLCSLLLLYSINLTYAELIDKEAYKISTDSIQERIMEGNFKEKSISITNKEAVPKSLFFEFTGDIANNVKYEVNQIIIEPKKDAVFTFTFLGHKQSAPGGFLLIKGDIDEKVALNLTIEEFKEISSESLIINIEPISKKAIIGQNYEYKVDIQNLLSNFKLNVSLKFGLDYVGKEKNYIYNKSFFIDEEIYEVNTSLSIMKKIVVPEFLKSGSYVINVEAMFLNSSLSTSKAIQLDEMFWDYRILGLIRVRYIILFTGITLISSLSYIFIYKKRKEKKKRYKSIVHLNLLPKPGKRSAYMGLIADTNTKTYFDIDQLTTHCLIAGSTGGGKTVSAEVLVEESLIKGVSIIVFDPTAQWTGFLRKNTSQKMFDLYPKFGLKKNDARLFNGNIKQILDAREIIDINKYIKPGEITIFAINRLDPKDSDILVANTIRQVFKANLPESPELKLIIIFDEVHRLLSKFGGTGEGFIQIERGAREFRKWGVGLFLISQVLTDFVGETKANINTEIQMRTRDQGDLDRIKTKYGSYMLQSLLKAATGTGMVENTAYNRGEPYFVAFRPLFHMHARLGDDELEKYNKYNEIVDQMEFEIQQLEKEGIDTFDMKLELKMALEKVKSGSFNMVDIYFEGLRPKLEDNWKKLGKSPIKLEKKMISDEELKEEFEHARKIKEELEKKQKGV